jgi:hypothetical protein
VSEDSRQRFNLRTFFRLWNLIPDRAATRRPIRTCVLRTLLAAPSHASAFDGGCDDYVAEEFLEGSADFGQSGHRLISFRSSTSRGRPRLRSAYSGSRGNCFKVKVPLTGLEPVLSALRGRRVNHLHHSGDRALVYTGSFVAAMIESDRCSTGFSLLVPVVAQALACWSPVVAQALACWSL